MSPHQSAERETTDATSSPTLEEAGPATEPGALDASPLDSLETVTDLDVLALSAPLGVFRSTEAGGIVWVNRRFLDITGLSRKQAMGHDWVRAIHPLDRPRIVAARQELYRAPHDVSIQYRIVRPDGTMRHVRVRVLPAPERPGEPTMVVGAMEDVTDRVDAPGVPGG